MELAPSGYRQDDQEECGTDREAETDIDECQQSGLRYDQAAKNLIIPGIGDTGPVSSGGNHGSEILKSGLDCRIEAVGGVQDPGGMHGHALINQNGRGGHAKAGTKLAQKEIGGCRFILEAPVEATGGEQRCPGQKQSHAYAMQQEQPADVGTRSLVGPTKNKSGHAGTEEEAAQRGGFCASETRHANPHRHADTGEQPNRIHEVKHRSLLRIVGLNNAEILGDNVQARTHERAAEKNQPERGGISTLRENVANVEDGILISFPAIPPNKEDKANGRENQEEGNPGGLKPHFPFTT